MKNRTELIRAIPALISALALIALADCVIVGDSGVSESGGSCPKITIGSKNFTEQYILSVLY